MEIVIFKDTEFRNIQEQDNPAYMSKEEWLKIGKDGCILITKQSSNDPVYKHCGRLVVMKITPVQNPYDEESVTKLGIFWNEDDALIFANAFIHTEK